MIAKVGMSRLDSACDAIDLVAATVDTLAGIVENDVFGVEFVDRCASPLRIVFTEDVVKIAGQQGRYAVGHGCCFSSLDRVPLTITYRAAIIIAEKGVTCSGFSRSARATVSAA